MCGSTTQHSTATASLLGVCSASCRCSGVHRPRTGADRSAGAGAQPAPAPRAACFAFYSGAREPSALRSLLSFYWDGTMQGQGCDCEHRAGAVTDWGWVTVTVTPPAVLPYYLLRPVYDSGHSAASCSETSPQWHPCPISTVITPSPRRCGMSRGTVR